MSKKDREEEARRQQQLKDEAAAFKEALVQSGGKIYPNMDNLPILTADAVLANLHNLYHKEQPTDPKKAVNYSSIYSQVGPILIALNPFKAMDCYNEEWQDAFHRYGQAGHIATAWRRLGPHCFCTIESAYQALKRNKKNQAVVICGESGAGKTWTCKLMLDYLLDMRISRLRADSRLLDEDEDACPVKRERAGSRLDEETSHKDMLSKCNVVLEAFGNAKTQRNDNSSRFGKFSSIYFDDDYQVGGCNFDHYLLERSRVIHVPEGERNYHILHYMAKAEQAKSGKEFRYLKGAMSAKRASEVEVNGKKSREFDDIGDFAELKHLMTLACFPEDVQQCMYDVFLGLLYLGNCNFTGEDKGKIDPNSQADFQRACELFGMDPVEMERALTHRTSPTIVKEPIPLSAEKAAVQKDNVAKTVYSRLFDWIIAQMNKAMLGLKNQYSTEGRGTVGLLDIFGFEDMDVNGFEQMFINLTNERIQHHFNNVMFAAEMKVYEEEGINVVFAKPDNSACVKLFTSNDANKVGLIRVLQECVKNQNQADGKDMKRLLENRLQAHEDWVPVDSKDFKNDAAFKVRHYAGVVTYQCKNFIEKSQDSVDQFVVEELAKSGKLVPPNERTGMSEAVNFFKELFSNDLREIEEKKAKNSTENTTVTVGVTFRQQLANLMDNKLGAYDKIFGGKEPEVDPRVDSVFVRCIKPRANSLATFDQAMVRSQLINGGVLSALHIRELGMPDRMEYEDFMHDFWCLECTLTGRRAESLMERTKAILGHFFDEIGHDGLPKFKCGKTKIFMKSGILCAMHEIAHVVHNRCARVIKYKWRAKAGLDMLTELTCLRDRVQRITEEAEELGVSQVGVVQKEAKKAQGKLDELFQLLKVDTETWEKTEGALKKRDRKELIRRGTEAAIADRIGVNGAVVKEDVKAARAAVDSAEGQISIVLARKRKAVDAMELLKLDKINLVQAQLERLDEVLRYCSATDPPERGGDLFRRCTDNKEQLGRIINEQIPALGNEVLRTVDLNVDNPPLALPSQAQTLVDEAKALVDATEKASEELIIARKKFAFQDMCANPELQALQKQREDAHERLDIIQQDIEQARALGFSQVTEAFSQAMRCDEAVEGILRDAMSGDKYVAALKEYLEAEKKVQEWVETMKRLEAEKAEREIQAKQTIFDRHVHSKELHQVYSAYVEHLMAFQEHLQTTGEKIAIDGLSGTKASIDEYSGKVDKLMRQLERVNLEAMVSENAGEQIKFNFKGPWSAECFKLLGAELLPVFEYSATLLDKSRFHNVVDAVEALNSGIMAIEDAYCLGFSETWGQYYLLFKKDKERAALDYLDKQRLVHANQVRAEQRKQLAEAVGGAINVLTPAKFEEDVRKKQEALESKIKSQIAGEMSPEYAAKAQERIKGRKAEMQKEADEEVEQARRSLIEVEAQRDEEQTHFQERVDELHYQLEKVQASTSIGIDGRLPALHKQLMDCGGICHGLMEQMKAVQGHIGGLVEDSEECLAYMDALMNNPRTLPGLKQFVEVLARSHSKHLEAEKVCKELGLEGQLATLNECREHMSQVDTKVRTILDGSVSHQKGNITPELQGMRVNLQAGAKLLDMLRLVFHSWTQRLLNAAQFIDNALECVDAKLDKVESLQEVVEKPHERGLWRHITRRVVENFCASRPAGAHKAAELAPALKLEGRLPPQLRHASSGSQEPRATAEVRSRHSDGGQRPWKDPSLLASKRKLAKVSIEVGDYVQDVATGKLRGIVRFTGPTSFAAGEWVGIELEGAGGRNDGSVAGKRYFACAADQGLFLRPTAVVKVGSRGAAGRSQLQARYDSGLDPAAVSYPPAAG